MIIGIDISAISYQTGVSRYTAELVLNLLKQDHTNSYKLFYSSLRQKLPSWFLQELKTHNNYKLYVYPIPPTLLTLLWNKLHFLPIELFIGKCDIFHTGDWTHPPTQTAKTVATIHDLTPFLFPQWHHPTTIKNHTQKLLHAQKDGCKYIFVSKNTKQDFIKLFPSTDISSSTVIYEASSENFVPTPNPTRDYLLVNGTREPRKNLDNIFKAYKIIYKKFPNLPLKVVGKYGWGEDVTPPAGVEVLGFVPEEKIAYYYQNALCLIYPSLYEGFGLPVLQAFSTKTPVITSKNSSLEEIAQDAALYVDPLDTKDISNKISLLINDPKLQTSLAIKGYEKSKNFSWKKTAEQTLSFYKKQCI